VTAALAPWCGGLCRYGIVGLVIIFSKSKNIDMVCPLNIIIILDSSFFVSHKNNKTAYNGKTSIFDIEGSKLDLINWYFWGLNVKNTTKKKEERREYYY